jgi:glyoxylase-like metal-dependent hydrolase (beta-lactamase superfamily II)
MLSVMPDQAPRYRFTLLRAGSFRLDGGSMFGLIPRSVWSRSVPTDDKGRITVAHNCLLLERVGGSDVLPRRVLVEVGTGDKLDAKMQEIFDLEKNPAGHPNAGRPRTIVDALAEHGVKPDQIDAVICSHLHFDHAGALTRLARPGEKPTWPIPPNDDGGGGSSQAGGCIPTFPNARIHIQQREWEDAVANRSVMTKTYYRDHLLPIADRVTLTDSPRPFPTGLTPDRDDLPRTTIEQRESDPFWTASRPNVESGISVFLTPGHTWGQQAIKFTEPDRPNGGGGRTIVFTPDVMPTIAHNGAAYSLSYDVEPYTSMISRRWLLTEAAARGWVLHLDHEPGHPLVRVRENAKGWFDLMPEAV